MRTSFGPALLAGSVLSLSLLLGAAPANAAGPAVGDAAPDFEGKTFINTDSVTLKALRGRLILFELFSTT